MLVLYGGSVGNFERVVKSPVWIHISTKLSHLCTHTSTRYFSCL